MQAPILPYGRQWIDDNDIEAVTAALHSDYLTTGPRVAEFEEALAARCGAAYAVVFNSGTSALHAAYDALGLGPGDEFITSPITFAATANVGMYLGAKPVFADVNPTTGLLDPASVRNCITNKTKAIVPVHYAGQPCDMDSLQRLAADHGLAIIEDAAHALGATHGEHRVGACSHSAMAMFSFHPVKHITSGEGGAITTNEKLYYDRLRLFRSHGITRSDFFEKEDGPWYYEMQQSGLNYRLTDFQAALGLSQLSRLDFFLQRRRAIAAHYRSALGDIAQHISLPAEPAYGTHSYHLFPLLLRGAAVQRRAALFTRLREGGIGVQVHYLPVYRHPFYRERGFDRRVCPNADDFYAAEISIPMFPAMQDEDVNRVAEALKSFFGGRTNLSSA